MIVSESQQPVRVIKTRGPGREALVDEEGVVLPPSNAPAPSAPSDDGFDVHKHYTLRQLLALMTAATVVLGMLRLVPASLGTSAVGLVVLVAMFFATDRRSTPAIIRLAWWMLLGIYLISAAVTVRGMIG